MATKKKGKKISAAQSVGLGIGITAAAASAAGAYFLYGSKNAAKNRKKVKGWMLKAKGDVLEALEHAEEMTKDEYDEVVEGIAGAYSTLQNATKGEISDFKKEMKEHWAKIEKNARPVKKAAKKAAKKAKKAVKKAAKKSTKKKSSKK